MEKKRITLSSSALNRKGYRVLTAGGKLEGFLKNPVMLFDHQSWRMAVGMWEDLKVEGDLITALPKFDENDPFGAALKFKYDNGFPIAASIGFNIFSTSEAPEHLLPGQMLSTVTEWDLLEASISPVQANPDATLSCDAPHTLSAIPPITSTQPDMELKKIASALGLPENADETAVLSAIERLGSDNKTLSAGRVETLLSVGEQNGIVTDANKESWRKLAMSDFDSTAALLKTAKVAAVPEPAPAEKPKAALLTGMLRAGGPAPEGKDKPGDGREDWTFDDWSKKDSKGLLKMKQEDSPRYASLAQQKYETS